MGASRRGEIPVNAIRRGALIFQPPVPSVETLDYNRHRLLTGFRESGSQLVKLCHQQNPSGPAADVLGRIFRYV